MIQNLETTLKSGGVPQVPQFNPSTTTAKPALHSVSANTQKSSTSSVPNSSTERTVTKEVKGKDEEKKTANAVSAPEKSSTNGVIEDPLGDARNKVQDEIIKEFAAIMATGTMRASEAAALATKRVMQRYGQIAVSQS